MDQIVAQRERRDGVGLLTVAVVGDFNSGKSTFINAILGKDLCPVGEEPTTSSVTHFIHGDKERIEQQSPEGERKPIEKKKYRSLVRHGKREDRESYIFHISVNSPILEHIRLVDTPGFNAPPPNTHDTKVTENALTEADALFVLIDTRKGNPTKSLLEQLDLLQHTKEDEFCPPMFLLLNKAEDLSPTQRTEVKGVCQTRYGDRFHNVKLISALQLNNSDVAEPLDALQTVTQQVRDAIMGRDPFEAQISAKVVTGNGAGIYRMAINGNVYEVPTVSASSLTSREELCEMVRFVSPERHVLLKRQLQRKTSQLREDWQKTLSILDYELKLALGEHTVFGDGTDDPKNKALESIDKAKFDLIHLVDGICEEVMDQMIKKDERVEEGFWSKDVFYQIIVNLEEARQIVTEHPHWDRAGCILNDLEVFFTRLGLEEIFGNEDDSEEDAGLEGFVEESIKKDFLDYLNEFQGKLIESVFEQEEDWKLSQQGNFNSWVIAYLDNEIGRDEYFNRLSGFFRESGIEYARDSTRGIQAGLDSLKEPIVSNAERLRSRSRERAEELDRLQQRINELKEHTP